MSVTKVYPVACRNCGRLIDSQGRCGCPEEDRRRSQFAGGSFLCAIALVVILILMVLCAGCNGWQARPLAEAELYEHTGYDGASAVTAGVTFISPGGACVDVAPSMRFDLLGGRTEELFDNQNFGGVIRLRFVK